MRRLALKADLGYRRPPRHAAHRHLRGGLPLGRLTDGLAASLGYDARELFCHSRLPARPCGPPLEDDILRQANGDQLLRIDRARPSPFVDLSSCKHVIGQFGKFVVLLRLNDMRCNLREVRSQGAGRRVLARSFGAFRRIVGDDHPVIVSTSTSAHNRVICDARAPAAGQPSALPGSRVAHMGSCPSGPLTCKRMNWPSWRPASPRRIAAKRSPRTSCSTGCAVSVHRSS
jgi:hypothetical protein